MFFCAWVRFRLILSFKLAEMDKCKMQNSKKRQSPGGVGGMRGLVGYPTKAFNLQSLLEVFMVLLYLKDQQTYTN
jgi:hypothetical protein